jgi:hypothetical protein
MATERQLEVPRSNQQATFSLPLQRKSIRLDSLLHAVPNRSSGKDDRPREKNYQNPIEL